MLFPTTRFTQDNAMANVSLEEIAKKENYTTGDAADLTTLSQQTIIRCFDSGRLRGFKVPGSRFRRIPRCYLIKFMLEHDIPLGPLIAYATEATPGVS